MVTVWGGLIPSLIKMEYKFMSDKELEEVLYKAIEYYFDGMSAREAIIKAMEEMKNGL